MRLLALLALAVVTCGITFLVGLHCGIAFLVGLNVVKEELRQSWRAR